MISSRIEIKDRTFEFSDHLQCIEILKELLHSDICGLAVSAIDIPEIRKLLNEFVEKKHPCCDI